MDPRPQIENERLLIGALLLDPRRMAEAVRRLPRGDMLSVPDHAAIYDAMIEMFRAGRDADMGILADRLEGKIRSPYSSLRTLMDGCPSPIAALDYADLVARDDLRRRAFQAGIEIQRAAREEDDLDGLISFVDRKHRELVLESEYRGTENLSPEISHVCHLAGQGHAISRPVSTGFTDLDHWIGGWERGLLHVIAARPSQGKTTFALNSATIAAESGKAVLFFSLEMTRREVALKLAARQIGIDSKMIYYGTLGDEHRKRLMMAEEKMSALPLYVCDHPSLTPTEIRSETLVAMRRHEVEAVFVDYLSYVRGPRSERKDIEIGEVTRSLKAMAKDLDVPYVVLAQLNRNIEHRDDDRPRLSDLRGSGDIEQDADVVIMLHREIMDDKPTDIVQILIEKQRVGPCGMLRLRYDRPTQRFQQLART